AAVRVGGLALRLDVRVGLGHLLRQPLVEGLAELLLQGRVAVALAGRPLLRRRVALVERLGQATVVGHAVAVALGLVLVVDPVGVVGFLDLGVAPSWSMRD